jgi:hypothetical protein
MDAVLPRPLFVQGPANLPIMDGRTTIGPDPMVPNPSRLQKAWRRGLGRLEAGQYERPFLER